MKIKTSELKKAALNWAVAQVRQLPLDDLRLSKSVVFRRGEPWVPDMYWEQGGPIIEEQGIDLMHLRNDDLSVSWVATWDSGETEFVGPTPLIAAMRCYVASKLGNEVEVPDELMEI